MPCPPGLYSLVGAGPLFIIPKLFIYIRGLSDPFLGSGTGWVRAAGWGGCPGHPAHFRLTQQSQAWPGFSLACLHPAALGHGAWNTGRVGSTGVFSSPDRPAHNPPCTVASTWDLELQVERTLPLSRQAFWGLHSMCNDTENHTLPHPMVTHLRPTL